MEIPNGWGSGDGDCDSGDRDYNCHDLHQRKVVKYDNVNTADNPADILTKALARDKHEKFARSMEVW